MSNIVIRQIEPNDNLLLAGLIRKVFREYGIDRPGTVYTDPTTDALYQLFEALGSACWVVADEGIPVGCCGVYPTEGLPSGCAELVKFYLSSDYRGKGLGKQLLRQCFDSARELGYNQLYLESFPELATAVGMYEKSGFRSIPHSLGNSGHTACTLWMVKNLQE